MIYYNTSAVHLPMSLNRAKRQQIIKKKKTRSGHQRNDGTNISIGFTLMKPSMPLKQERPSNDRKEKIGTTKKYIRSDLSQFGREHGGGLHPRDSRNSRACPEG